MHPLSLPPLATAGDLLPLVGPAYVPPYPGAVEDELAWHLVKYLREDAVLRSEVETEISTVAGPAFFTLDFVVDVPVDDAGAVRRIAFEVGGARTLTEHERRLRRDATLLAHGAVDAVYRMRSADLVAHLEDVLFLASQWDPDAFSERGCINLRTLASREVRGVVVRPEQPSVLVPYALDDDGDAASALWHVANGQSPHVLVRRLDRRMPDVWRAYADGAPRAEGADLRLVDVPAVRRAA